METWTHRWIPLVHGKESWNNNLCSVKLSQSWIWTWNFQVTVVLINGFIADNFCQIIIIKKTSNQNNEQKPALWPFCLFTSLEKSRDLFLTLNWTLYLIGFFFCGLRDSIPPLGKEEWTTTLLLIHERHRKKNSYKADLFSEKKDKFRLWREKAFISLKICCGLLTSNCV